MFKFLKGNHTTSEQELTEYEKMELIEQNEALHKMAEEKAKKKAKKEKVEQELTYDEAFELVEQNEALHKMAKEKQNKLIAKRLKKENKKKKEQSTSNINTL